MQNINKPGVFPGVIALLLALVAVRSYFSLKNGGDKRFRISLVIGTVGAIIYAALAIFALLEAGGVQFG